MKFYGPHQLQFPNSVKISKLREGSPLARGHLLLLPLPWHLFQKMLSSIPEFSGFRALFQSSEPMELTEAETEYAVSVVKHMSLSALMPQMLRIFQGFVQSLLQACRIIHLEKFLLLLKSQIVYLLLGNFKICSSSQLKRLFSFVGVSHLLAKSGWVLALGLQTLIDCIGKRI